MPHRSPRRRIFPLIALPLLLLSMVALGGYARARVVVQPEPAAGRRTLVIALDGLAWDAFARARELGLFRRFPHAGRHVAPYPSMSHPAWNEVMGARRVFGARGNIRTIEARWFDLDAMRLADDPRQVIARSTSPYSVQRIWDYSFDPIIEPLMYLKGRRLFDRELAEAERAILDEFTGDRYIAYIAGSDAMSHTHPGELIPYLARVDSMLNRVVDSLEARGTPVDLWLLSDHGNGGGFAEHERERELSLVSLDGAIRRAGLVRRDTGRIEAANEVAVATIALATMANVYFADLSRRRGFATRVVTERGVELVTWLEVASDDRYVVIMDREGEARLRWRDSSYSYERIRGNPLRLPDSLTTSPGERRWIADRVMRAATEWTAYPDAAYRIVQSALKQVENAPDLIVNLGDGFAHGGDLGRFVRMVRTHGSLSARSSLGVIASSARPVPAHVRSEEVLGVMGVTPQALFHRVADLQPREPLAVARELARGSGYVATHRDDDARDLRFQRRARPIVLSMDYFPQDAMRSLRHAVGSAGPSSRMTRTRGILKRANVVDGIAQHLDTLLSLLDSLDVRTLSDRTRLAEQRIARIPDLAPLAELRGVWRGDSGAPGAAAPIRRASMALWTVPYFVDAMLAAPEWDSIPDPRDLRFAHWWHGGARATVAARPVRLLDDSTLARRVFGQVLAERTLMRAVEPATVPLMYDSDVSHVTIVYVPGIYDELFDGEIWSRGLRAIRERLGARTLTIPVDGRCGSAINGARIIDALRDDTRRRLERGYPVPRYAILGYSKGGVDATEAVARAPELARSQIAAVVSIATPHRGTAVAERADVPELVLTSTVAKPMPAACDSASASQSLWPATRSAFWVAQNDGRSLAPLTRFFSVSFVADARQSHPWMKITKQIGQFREPNDGVVPVSSSRFPTGVQAIDLGVVAADHIAGRLASDFPQDAFLEAVVLTLAEVGALAPKSGERWRQLVASRESDLWRGIRRWYGGDETSAKVPAFEASLRAPTSPPGGGTGWTPDRTFRMGGVGDFADVDVPEMTPDVFPALRVRCDQRNMEAFRREYEFIYDAGNGGSEDDGIDGSAIMLAPGSRDRRACHFATASSSIKMTTVSHRFRPIDYPTLALRLHVARGLTGVDVSRQGLGRNDAAFKLWLILRDSRPSASGRVMMFGYAWAGVNSKGVAPAPGTFQEARLSRRNLIVTTLPESWLVAIGGPESLGEWTTVERDLAQDIQRAYPAVPLEAMQVIGITLQTDSDESSSATSVFLESIDIESRRSARPMALLKAAQP
jgi:hypothetical protein